MVQWSQGRPAHAFDRCAALSNVLEKNRFSHALGGLVGDDGRLATSEAVIDVAARTLLARGFSDLTLRHVADDAGLSLDELHAVFDRKECLVHAIVDRAAALFTCPLDAAVTAPGNPERLEELLVRQLGTVDANRDVFLVAILRLLRPADYPVLVPPLSSGLSRLEHYFVRFEDWLATHVTPSSEGKPALPGHVGGGAVVGLLTHWASRGGLDCAAAHAGSLAAMLARRG